MHDTWLQFSAEVILFMPKHLKCLDLLERKCICSEGKCFTQFQLIPHAVSSERARFQSLNARVKEPLLPRSFFCSTPLQHLKFKRFPIVIDFVVGGLASKLVYDRFVSRCKEIANLPDIFYCCSVRRKTHKEALIRKWYNLIDDDDFEAGAAAPSAETLLESDDSDAVLLQTDSDDDNPLCTASDLDQSDHEALLLQSDSEEGAQEPPAKKRRYKKRARQSVQLKFLEKSVCARAHQRLYGIGSGAMQNLRAGRKAFNMHDGRLTEPKHPTLGLSLGRSSAHTKWPNILSFFWMLYISVAEIMPTKFVMPSDGKYTESFMEKDPDFEERYTRAFMSSIEKNFDLSPANCLLPIDL